MLLRTRDGAVAFLSIDRPQARNALALADWAALADHARELAASDARAVVVRSAVPGIFSAGADIGEFAGFAADPSAASGFRVAMRAGLEALEGLPMPVIAAVDGGCFGAAVALALACDIRVAGAQARFATTPAKLGLGYPREDVARLTACVGRGQAARMLFAGEPVDAAEAHRIGLAELYGDTAEPLAREVAARIAANAPDAVRLLKRTLGDTGAAELDAAFDAAFAGTELAEGLDAFRARRAPRFA